MKHKLTSTESYEILTPIFDITRKTNYVEFLMPDGRFFYYEFEKNHKIREKTVYNLFASVRDTGESIQGTNLHGKLQ